MRFVLWVGCAFVLLLSACGDKGDARYVGEWRSTDGNPPGPSELSVRPDGTLTLTYTMEWGNTDRVQWRGKDYAKGQRVSYSGEYTVKTAPERIEIQWKGDAPDEKPTRRLQLQEDGTLRYSADTSSEEYERK